MFDGKKAIRGGIPVVFPQFGPWELGPQHGFARISKWELHDSQFLPACAEHDGQVVAVFQLKDNDLSRELWGADKKFTLLYTVTVAKDSLTTHFSVTNDGAEPFDYTCLLHST